MLNALIQSLKNEEFRKVASLSSSTVPNIQGPSLRSDARRPPHSPIHAPYGFNDSIWSKTIFMAAVMGTARTRPIAPHSHPQTSSAMVTARGFNCRRLPRNFG